MTIVFTIPVWALWCAGVAVVAAPFAFYAVGMLYAGKLLDL